MPPPAPEDAARCEHHEVCHRPEHTAGTGTCILHDPDMEKDRDAFDTALTEHRERLRERRETAKAYEGDAYEPRWERRDDFRYIVFPDNVSFADEIFLEEGVDVSNAAFGDRVQFEKIRSATGPTDVRENENVRFRPRVRSTMSSRCESVDLPPADSIPSFTASPS